MMDFFLVALTESTSWIGEVVVSIATRVQRHAYEEECTYSGERRTEGFRQDEPCLAWNLFWKD